jgi:hypothetical protein
MANQAEAILYLSRVRLVESEKELTSASTVVSSLLRSILYATNSIVIRYSNETKILHNLKSSIPPAL